MSAQAPSAVVLVRPHYFDVNPITAADNVFQSAEPDHSAARAASAYREATALAEALRAEGVRVHLFEDERNDPRVNHFREDLSSVDGSLIVVPLRGRRGAIGVLTIERLGLDALSLARVRAF